MRMMSLNHSMLAEFLFPQEVIEYQSQYYIRYGGQPYVLYITNRRVIGHKREGFIFKKDKVFSVALEEISNLHYKEKGLIHKTGVLLIETVNQIMPFEGEPADVKVIWQEMQKHLGYDAPLGAPTAYTDSSHSGTSEKDPMKVLNMRLAKGEITKEQYEELRKALQSN